MKLDTERVRQYIEDSADLMEEHGFPRMACRVIGALMICAPPLPVPRGVGRAATGEQGLDQHVDTIVGTAKCRGAYQPARTSPPLLPVT